MKHYLIAADETVVQEFETFNAPAIKKAIIEYLTANPSGMLTHEKECKNNFNDIVNFYQNNPKNSEVSRVISKGDKELFIPIS